MKLWRLKINSSVIVFNGLALLAALAALVVGYLTDNQDMLKTILSPTQLMIVTLVQSAITVWLRTVNVTGDKPIEIITDSKETK